MKIGEKIYPKELITKYIDKILPENWISPIQIKNFILRKALDLLSLDLQDKETILLIQKINNKTWNLLKNRKEIVNLELSKSDLVLPEPMNRWEKGRYEKFAFRENEKETALEFLERVWGKYIKAGLLSQTELRWQQKNIKNKGKKGLDKTLFNWIQEQCKKEGLKMRDYIPTKSDKIIGKKFM